jgi:hypothetical protein
VVDWVNVLHAIQHNLAHFLQALVPSHGGDSVSLNEDVALREELDGL